MRACKSKFFFNKGYLIIKSKPTKRAPDAGDSGVIPSIFLRLIIFPVGRRSAARPSAGNANRWGAGRRANTKPSLICKFRFMFGSEIQIHFFSGGVFQVWFESGFQRAIFQVCLFRSTSFLSSAKFQVVFVESLKLA